MDPKPTFPQWVWWGIPPLLVALSLIFPVALQNALGFFDGLISTFYSAVWQSVVWVFSTAFHIKVSTGYGNLDGLLGAIIGLGMLMVFGAGVGIYFGMGNFLTEQYGDSWPEDVCEFLKALPWLLFFAPLLLWGAVHTFAIVLVNPLAWLLTPDRSAPHKPTPVPTVVAPPASTLDLPKPPYDLKALRAKYKVDNDYMTVALIMGGGAYSTRSDTDGKIYRGYSDVSYKVNLVSGYNYQEFVRRMRLAHSDLQRTQNTFLYVYVLPPVSIFGGGTSNATVMKLADNENTNALIYQICNKNQLSPPKPRASINEYPKNRRRKSADSIVPDYFS